LRLAIESQSLESERKIEAGRLVPWLELERYIGHFNGLQQIAGRLVSFPPHQQRCRQVGENTGLAWR